MENGSLLSLTRGGTSLALVDDENGVQEIATNKKIVYEGVTTIDSED